MEFIVNHKKFFVILLLFCILIYEINLSLFQIYEPGKNIFSFWEPNEKIPGYLRSCIKTWKKFFPDYKIHILGYKKVKEYLGEFFFSSIICKNMSIPMQADAIRVALLKKFGGIWLDTDTIILNNKFIKHLKNFELVMIGEEKYKSQYIGFIYASNKSSLLNEWLNQIIVKVKNYKNFISHKKNTSVCDNSWNKMKSYFYLGYDIINPLLKNIRGKKYLRLDVNDMNVFPERKFFKNSSLDYSKQFEFFYFEKGDPQIILNDSIDLIMLHHSWTPPKYKNMSENEFLQQDILISKLLSKILEKNKD